MKRRIEAKNKVPNMVILPLSGIRLEELLEQESVLNLIKTETPKAIYRAILANRENATILEINNSGYFIEVPYLFWGNALNSCLSYTIAEENFESSRLIQKIIDALNSYKRIPTTVRKRGFKRKQHGE